jgi:plasmid stabilization system protein ParE
MLRLEWSTPAADALEAAQDYYHGLNPVAARLMARRIVDAAKRLREQPQIGRSGLREGTREWVVSRTPYVLVYRLTPQAVEILHVWHTAQDWMQQPE